MIHGRVGQLVSARGPPPQLMVLLRLPVTSLVRTLTAAVQTRGTAAVHRAAREREAAEAGVETEAEAEAWAQAALLPALARQVEQLVCG